MISDMDYYRYVRRSDPSYGAYEAFREWIGDHPDVAVELAEKIWPEEDPETFPMSWDEMRIDLEGLDVMDVFFAGYFSYPNVDNSDEYFVKDGNGHFSSLPDWKYERACVNFMRDEGFEPIVIDKKYPAPKELAEVLALWEATVRTENIRPTARKDRGRGSCRTAAKKAPSKSRKNAGQSKKSSNVKSRNTKSSNTSSRKTAPAGRGVGGRRRCI